MLDFVIKNGVLKQYNGFNRNVIIPDGVLEIGKFAFCERSFIESITIPDSVITISLGAFYECISLKRIAIPDSVTNIGNNVFKSCASLESVTLSEDEDDDLEATVNADSYENCYVRAFLWENEDNMYSYGYCDEI